MKYAPWLLIYYRNMVTLEQRHPQLAQEFQSGDFVILKLSRRLLTVANDQAHEQANAVIKADWGWVRSA